MGFVRVAIKDHAFFDEKSLNDAGEYVCRVRDVRTVSVVTYAAMHLIRRLIPPFLPGHSEIRVVSLPLPNRLLAKHPRR
jgi:hypothetical protein